MRVEQIRKSPGAVAFLLALVFFVNASAQVEEESYIELPDTFHFSKPENVISFASLDSRGVVIDSFDNGRIYLVQTVHQWFGSQYAVAVKRHDGYVTFDALNNAQSYLSDISCELVDFNGRGSLELAIRWEHYAGHTGWENSIHERQRGLVLWDIDSLVCLINVNTRYSMENWWTVYEPDSTESIPYDEREVIDSGGEQICESYVVKILTNELQFLRIDDCFDEPDTKQANADDTVIRYELTPIGLIRRN